MLIKKKKTAQLEHSGYEKANKSSITFYIVYYNVILVFVFSRKKKTLFALFYLLYINPN
jgi:hypothetical protein